MGFLCFCVLFNPYIAPCCLVNHIFTICCLQLTLRNIWLIKLKLFRRLVHCTTVGKDTFQTRLSGLLEVAKLNQDSEKNSPLRLVKMKPFLIKLPVACMIYAVHVFSPNESSFSPKLPEDIDWMRWDPISCGSRLHTNEFGASSQEDVKNSKSCPAPWIRQSFVHSITTWA